MQEQIQKIIEIRERAMAKYKEATVWGLDGTQIQLCNLLYDAIEDAYLSGQEDKSDTIVKIIKSNSKGSFIDAGGNDCWYIDSLVKLIALTNNKDEKRRF